MFVPPDVILQVEYLASQAVDFFSDSEHQMGFDQIL